MASRDQQLSETAAPAQRRPPQARGPQAQRPDPNQQINQLAAEVRLLEAYFQEIEMRLQTASAALFDTRAANDALNALSTSTQSELLVPVGGGVLVPVNAAEKNRLILNVGAGVAIEKTADSAKLFVRNRTAELEKALGTLEQQRREIGSRLDAGRGALQQMLSQRQSSGSQ